MQFKQKTNIIKMLIITALLTVTTSFVSLAAQHSQKLESHLYATAYDDMHNNGGHQENGNQVLEASIGNTIGMSREGFNTVNNSTLLVMDVSHFYSTRYGLGYNTYDGYSKAGSFEFRKSNGYQKIHNGWLKYTFSPSQLKDMANRFPGNRYVAIALRKQTFMSKSDYYPTSTTLTDMTGVLNHVRNGCNQSGQTETTAASCSHGGVRTRKCTTCGKTETQNTPANGVHHQGSWSSWSKLNETQHQRTRSCSECHKTETQTGNHSQGSWSNWQDHNETQHKRSHTCSTCNYTAWEYANHTYGDQIIDKAATCSAKGSKHKICSQCGHRVDTEIEIDPSAHDYQQKDYDENGVTKAYKQKTCTHDPSHRDGERIYYTNKVTFSFEDERGVTPKVTIGTVERKRGETVSANEINTGIMKYSGSGTGNVSAGIKAYPLQSNDVFQYPDANGKPYQVINKNTTVLVNGDVEVILHVNIHQLPVVLDLNTPNMYVDGKQTSTKVKTAPAYPKNGTAEIKELQVIPTTAYLDQNTQRYLKDLKPVLTDQTFQGWALDKEGKKMISSSTPFTVGESTNAAGKDVVYAIWAPVFPTLGNVTVPENGMIEAVVNYTTPEKYRAKYDPYKVTGKRQYSSDAGNDTKAYYTVTGTNVKTYTWAYIDGSSVLSIPGGQTQNKKYTGQPTITSFANTLTNKKGEFYQGSSLLVKNPYRLNNEKTIRVTGENNTGTVYKDVKLSVVQLPTFHPYMQSGEKTSTLDNDKLKAKIQANKSTLTSFVRATEKPDASALIDNNIVSTADSTTPIYVQASNDGKTISWYSESKSLMLNDDISYMFNGCSKLTDISGLQDINTHKLRNIGHLFDGCSSLSDISPISNQDTSYIKYMGSVFRDCISITSLDAISNWDISNVVYLDSFVRGTGISDLAALSRQNTSNVKDLSEAFSRCPNLTSLAGVENWDTGKVTDIRYLCHKDTSLTDISALQNWNTSKCTALTGVFDGSKALADITGLENQDTSNVTDMFATFYKCNKLKSTAPLKNWNTSKVTNMCKTFAYNDALNDLSGLSNQDTSKVTTLEQTFVEDKLIPSIDGLKNWDVSSVSTLSCMFYMCENIPSTAPLKNWNTQNVTDMCKTFAYCDALTDLSGLSNWNTSKVTTMEQLFVDDTLITSLAPLRSWNTENVTNMEGTFYGCKNAANVTAINDWNINKVTSFKDMFGSCSSHPTFTKRAGTQDSDGTFTPAA